MSRYEKRMITVMALGILLFLMVDLTDMAQHPDIWSHTYVLVLNIISKVIGGIMVLTGIVLFSFFEPKEKK